MTQLLRVLILLIVLPLPRALAHHEPGMRHLEDHGLVVALVALVALCALIISAVLMFHFLAPKRGPVPIMKKDEL